MLLHVRQEGLASMVGAVDIGGTKIAVGLVDELGRIAAKDEFPTCVDRGFEVAMGRVAETLRTQIASTHCQLQGIGIGCTGPVDPVSGVLGNVNLLTGWEGKNPVDRLSREFNIFAAIENDADAVAIGEAMCGIGKGKRSLVCITVGTGIGSGVIIHGEVYRGVEGNHPELGHQIIEPAGPLCTCGLYGCWESLASGPAMALWMQENAPSEYSGKDLTAEDICILAQQGNEPAIRAVQREAKYLGIGIANVITCFLPEVLLLGGSVMKSAHLFLPRIKETIDSGCQIVPGYLCQVSPTTLGDYAGLIGAAQVWYYRFTKPRSSCEV